MDTILILFILELEHELLLKSKEPTNTTLNQCWVDIQKKWISQIMISYEISKPLNFTVVKYKHLISRFQLKYHNY
jgi:hypothetical protein